MKHESAFNRWCRMAWIHFSLCIAFLMTAVILYYWQEWSVELKVVAAVCALIPIHVVEEWVFPGGFHYQYNSFRGSSQLDRYPLSRLTDVFVNLLATFMYAALTLYCAIKGEVANGIVIGTIIFCALEVIVHSILGLQMYRKFKSKGKQTIYGPGSITAYFCFGVFGIILCYQLSGQVITTTDWIVGLILSFGGVGVVCVLSPEILTRKCADDYAFPSAGYFERFLK